MHRVIENLPLVIRNYLFLQVCIQARTLVLAELTAHTNT